MKRNKEKHQMQAQFQLYIQSVLINYDHEETITTLKKVADKVGLAKKSTFKKS
jgi:uncharacterized protein (DUF302 family)